VLNLAWNEAYLATVNDGSTATGTITGTVGAVPYTNTFTMVVKRDAAWTAPTSVTGIALNTPVNSGLLPVNDFNVPVTVSFANPTTGTIDPMGSVSVAVNGVSTAVTLGTTTVTLNPGDTFQLFGSTGGTNNKDYGISVTIGTAAPQEWYVKTTPTAPSIGTPQIQTPGNNTTGVGTASGIIITGDAYDPLNGAGAQSSSTWEVYSGSYPLESTNVITGVTANPPTSTPVQTTADNLLYGAASGNAVAFGTSSGDVYYSRTGASGSWFTATPTGNNTQWVAASPTMIVGFGGGRGGFRLGSTGGAVGFDVSATVPNAFSSANGAVYDPVSGRFIAGGWMDISNPNAYVVYGSDGSTWTAGTITGVQVSAGATGFATDGIGNVVIQILNGSGTVVLKRSTNGGASWSEVALTLSGGDTAFWQSSLVGGGGKLWGVGSTTKNVYVSSNGGTTWTTTGVTFTNGVGGAQYNNGYLTFMEINTPQTSSNNGTSFTPLTLTYRPPVYYSGSWYFATSPAPGPGLSTGNLFGSTTLAIANCQAEGFLAGDTVVSNPSGGGPATILSLDNSQVTVTSSTGWLGNSSQKLTRATSSYTAVTGSPYTVTTSPLESLTVPKPPLAANTKYYVRVRYSTTTPSAIDSDWSPWSGFTTGSLIPAIGALFGGGYFGGQINDGGTIYNLVVAPLKGDVTGPNPAGTLEGQRGGATPTGIQWKNAATGGDTTAQNQVYGKTATDLYGANPTTYPMFGWCLSASGPNAGATSGGTGIGGHNDWYIPAKNELEILYYNLKPTTTTNSSFVSGGILSGTNPNSIPPRTGYNSVANPAVNPAQTTNALFQSGGSEAFSTANNYWSATENSSNTNNAWDQLFSTGGQANTSKPSNQYARAIRRVAA
jgi:hypothetical protein